MRVAPLLLVLASVVALSGCPKKPQTLPDASNTGANSGASTGGASSSDLSGSALSEDERALQQLQQSGMVVYFDYDRADIKPEYISLVAAHAKYLSGASNRRVRLEGHSDERGSREYNIGLGERRAQSVRRALMLQGVTEAQITTVSYGEERPAVQGSDETAYSKNRRVELSYAR